APVQQGTWKAQSETSTCAAGHLESAVGYLESVVGQLESSVGYLSCEAGQLVSSVGNDGGSSEFRQEPSFRAGGKWQEPIFDARNDDQAVTAFRSYYDKSEHTNYWCYWFGRDG
ncbi:MAG: hypothetical protein ACPGWR_16715, partial [Ardenticatenaceae bacterium]